MGIGRRRRLGFRGLASSSGLAFFRGLAPCSAGHDGPLFSYPEAPGNLCGANGLGPLFCKIIFRHPNLSGSPFVSQATREATMREPSRAHVMLIVEDEVLLAIDIEDAVRDNGWEV